MWTEARLRNHEIQRICPFFQRSESTYSLSLKASRFVLGCKKLGSAELYLVRHHVSWTT